jgi:hypothetical protein
MDVVNRVLTEAQRELLTAVLNRIIPAEVRVDDRVPLPGAGDLGVASFVEGMLNRNSQLRRLFLEGLARIEITAAQRGNKEFLGLSDADKDATLHQVETEHPQFFGALVRQTYSGYYTHPRIFQLIGYDINRTYQPEPFDESLLEKQRQRAPFWRQV